MIADLALWTDERVILKCVARGASIGEIARALRVSKMTVRRRLYGLNELDLAQSDGTGWRLTERGRDAIEDRVCV